MLEGEAHPNYKKKKNLRKTENSPKILSLQKNNLVWVTWLSISQYFHIIEKVQIFKIKGNLKSEKWKNKNGNTTSIFKSLAEKKERLTII